MITIDQLKESGGKPHFFGLGFIQLKLNERERVHFYHPELMANVPEEELHDHRYDFTSRIISGELINDIWQFSPDENGASLMGLVSCVPEKPVLDDAQDIRGNIVHAVRFATGPGCEYSISMDQFHRVSAERAVTFLRRGEVKKDFARVIREQGAPQVCPFEVSLSEKECWEMMADLLGEPRNPGYHLRGIKRGEVGELSKIREELEELEDAAAQGARIMELVEASDLLGAVSAYVGRHHPGTSMEDLLTMSKITKRAFLNGHR